MNSELQNTETAEIQVAGDINFQELVAKSEGLTKLKPVMTLTADYIELEKPEDSFRGVYIGLGDISVTDKGTGEQRQLKSARFLIDKQVKINSGVNLVRQLDNVPVGTPVEVTYTKKEGNVKIYNLSLLG
jgi:hypothetical protein